MAGQPGRLGPAARDRRGRVPAHRRQRPYPVRRGCHRNDRPGRPPVPGHGPPLREPHGIHRLDPQHRGGDRRLPGRAPGGVRRDRRIRRAVGAVRQRCCARVAGPPGRLPQHGFRRHPSRPPGIGHPGTPHSRGRCVRQLLGLSALADGRRPLFLPEPQRGPSRAHGVLRGEAGGAEPAHRDAGPAHGDLLPAQRDRGGPCAGLCLRGRPGTGRVGAPGAPGRRRATRGENGQLVCARVPEPLLRRHPHRVPAGQPFGRESRGGEPVHGDGGSGEPRRAVVPIGYHRRLRVAGRQPDRPPRLLRFRSQRCAWG